MRTGRSRYTYDGPITDKNGKEICRSFVTSTYAESERRAAQNVLYQFKMRYNMEPHCAIALDKTKLKFSY